MRLRTWIGVCVVSCVAIPTAAQTRAENTAKCNSPDPTTRLDGCLGLITSETDLGLLVPAHVNRATAALELGQDDLALAEFSAAIREAPSYGDAYNYRAICYARKQLFDRALADCNQAIRLGARAPGLYTARGFLYLKVGQPDKALADYDKALKVDAKDWLALYRRGCLLSKRGQYDRAIADYDGCLRLEPSDQRALLGRAAASLKSGQPEKAIADYDRALDLRPDVHGAAGYRGMAYELWSEFADPAPDLDTAITLAPTRPQAVLARGLAKLLAGDLPGAVADMRSAIESTPSSERSLPYALLWEDIARQRLGQGAAAALAGQAAKLDFATWPGPVLQYYLGQITLGRLQAAGASPDAATARVHACEIDFYAGELHLWQGERAEAAARFRAARDGCPPTSFEREWAAVELGRIPAR